MSDSQQQLAAIVRDRIGSGRITFAEFMELVLYHPDCGYYGSGAIAFGAEGDYFTSASLGADLGELLAVQLVEIWERLGRPHPFHLVEMGAGQGQLAADILGELARSAPECLAAVAYLIVETSPALIARQQTYLDAWDCVQWRSWETIADESLGGCCFSNELVDAFPVHRVAIADGKLREIYVTLSETGQLVEAIAEPSTPQLSEYFARVSIEFPSAAYPEGYRTEVNLAALRWLETVARKLRQGYLLTIDYGYEAQRYYAPQRSDGTLQCYFQHRRHADPYVNLGRQDITSHVDFTVLERHGAAVGLAPLGCTRQGLFLMALGLGDRLFALSSGDYGARDILQRRDALHQLLDPSGLGGFTVLVQGKQVETEPLRGLLDPAR